MQNYVSLALYTSDDDLLRDVLARGMETVTFADQAQEDGIHRDGSFLQHNGLLCASSHALPCGSAPRRMLTCSAR